MAKRTGRARTARASCQRCTQLRLFCDVPGSCSQCRKRGCNCSPAGNEVPGGRNTAITVDPRKESGARVESSSSIQPPSAAPPPAGQLPQGWQCFHDSETNRDYYVSPTGHIQWQHPLQGPIPPPLLRAFPTQARGFSVGRQEAPRTNNGPLRPAQDNKRNRGEEVVRSLPAPFTTRAYSPGGSTMAHPVAQPFRIQPHLNTTSTAGAAPSGPRSVGQPLSRVEFLGAFRCNGGPARGRPGGLQRRSRTMTGLPFNKSEEALPTQAANGEVEDSQEAPELAQTEAHDEAVKIEKGGAADEQELVKFEGPVKEEKPRDFGLRSRGED